jgi:hypothetical protein
MLIGMVPIRFIAKVEGETYVMACESLGIAIDATTDAPQRERSFAPCFMVCGQSVVCCEAHLLREKREGRRWSREQL